MPILASFIGSCPIKHRILPNKTAIMKRMSQTQSREKKTTGCMPLSYSHTSTYLHTYIHTNIHTYIHATYTFIYITCTSTRCASASRVAAVPCLPHPLGALGRINDHTRGCLLPSRSLVCRCRSEWHPAIFESSFFWCIWCGCCGRLV